MSSPRILRLEVQIIEQVCSFRLTGDDVRIAETLPYPDSLPRLYREWQLCYLSYYKTKSLRGKHLGSGSLPPTNDDWQSKLGKAEENLLREFHRWLKNLHRIQDEIAKVPSESDEDATSGSNKSVKTQLFITCIALDLTLERLPWETWRVMTPLHHQVQILRTASQWQQSPKQQIRRRGKPRILAILGDDTNLTLEQDRSVIGSLIAVADVELMSWQTLPDLDLLREQICQKLSEPKGWDVLFFAGHSQESTTVGGELVIAPGVSLSIRDMTPALKKAQAQGLRLAIFNSCNGLGIALELIALGLSQVLAMREPIDNGAAQVFLAKFVEGLRAYQSIDDALLKTREHLEQKGKVLHPSAFLIPSLYCHPDAELFQFRPWGLWQRLRRWQPSLKLKVLGVCLGVSLLPSLHPTFLLDGRLLTQLLWREMVSSPAETSPEQILVQIDDDSLRAANVNSLISPLNRSYLARLVNDLVKRKSQVIGLDYVFDYPTANDLALKTAFETAVEKQKTWLVFAAVLRDGSEIGINGRAELANLNWSVQGDVIGYFPYYMNVLQPGGDCKEVCPFSTVLATIYQFDRSANLSASLKPNLQSSSDLRDRVVTAIKTSDRDSILKKIIQSPFQINFLETIKPLNDFSIRSDRVYTKISAGCLIDPKEVLNECPELPDFQGKIVIIAAGEYPGAGEKGLGDSDPAPLAFKYPDHNKDRISRGEVHSYMVSQLLNQHFVKQVPDILGVLLAVPLAQILLRLLRSRRIKVWKESVFVVFKLKKSRFKQQRSLIVALLIGDVIYLGIVLQIYVSAAILVPWLLPVLTLNSLVLLDRRKHEIE